MALKGQPAVGKHAAGLPRPHMWRVGDDPELHKRYLIWLQQKNQAQWRGETWELSFESWLDKWKDHWHLRGRKITDYCMTRHDVEGPWDDVNSIIMTRREHHSRHMARQHALGKTRGYKKKLEDNK